jgi:hypothetical protein
MAQTHPEETTVPLAITVKRASKISDYSERLIWKFIREGRIKTIRVPGVRRTPPGLRPNVRC